jgi:hypothetical protein
MENHENIIQEAKESSKKPNSFELPTDTIIDVSENVFSIGDDKLEDISDEAARSFARGEIPYVHSEKVKAHIAKFRRKK